MDGEARQILAIPVDQIDESPSNPRKHFDEAYLRELAEDLKQQGQLQAARVRPKGERYELVFGACRLRALRLAGLPTLDATVHEYSDLDALAVQLRENSKRLDVHPLEEADGYRELRDVHHLSIDEIAAKVSKEPGYVRHRLQYCTLGPKGRELFLTGKLSTGTALLVARIPVEALREQAAKEIAEGQWSQGPMGPRDAGNWVRDRYMLRLANAPFDRGAEDLVAGAGACTTCPKRTGAQPELFADVQSPDTCTDPTCFKAKKDAAWQQRVDAAKAEGQKVLSKKAAEEVFTYGNRVDRGSEFADLGAELDGFGGKTAKELLKKAKAALPPVTLARDEAGGVHELVDKAALKKALKAAGVEKPKAERVSGDDDWKAKQRERTATGKAVVERVLAALVPAAEKFKVTLALWKFLALALVEHSWASSEFVAKRRGLLDGAKGHAGPQQKLNKLAATMNEGALRGLAVELLVAGECSYGRVGDGLSDACKTFGVDLKKIETEVAAERKAAAKAKAAKSAKATAKKPAAAKSSSVPKPVKAPTAQKLPPPPVPKAVERVRFILARTEWDGLSERARQALTHPFGKEVAWRVQRTAVTLETPIEVGSDIYEHLVEYCDLDVPEDERQCTGCGCVEALACGTGWSWAGPTLCSACKDPQAKPAPVAAPAGPFAEQSTAPSRPEEREPHIPLEQWEGLSYDQQHKLTFPTWEGHFGGPNYTVWKDAGDGTVTCGSRNMGTDYQLALVRIAGELGVTMEWREPAPPPSKKKASKEKGPQPFHKQPFPAADALVFKGMATAAYLDPEGWHAVGRQPGESGDAWTTRLQAIADENGAAHLRVYDASGRCTLDSRDKAPVPSAADAAPTGGAP